MAASMPSNMYDVYRLHEIKSKLNYKFESVAVLGDLFFLGTSEGKIIVYEVNKTPTNTFECTTIHIQTSKTKQPVKQMVPIIEKHILVVLIGEQIVVHQLHELDKNQMDRLPGDKMPEILTVKNCKEVIAFHIKKERNVYYLAAILRKKVMVFELKENATGNFRDFAILRDGLVLPDGIRTVNWAGRGLVLGFRKEYVMMDVMSGEIDPLFPTSKSATPVLCNTDPIPELIVGDDSAGLRITLEGEPAARAGVLWTSLPTWMVYQYPYLLSIHDGNSIEVRNPSLITAAFATDGSSQKTINTLCQTLSVKYVDRISCKGYVDFDMTKPDAKTDPMLLRRDITVATNGQSSVYLLELIPIREQALSLAANRNFDASIELCKLCPNEVPTSTVQDIKIKYGLWCFAQKKFADAISKFVEGGADPRFVISLFPDFLPAYVKAQWKSGRSERNSALDARELSECLEDALLVLLGYLNPLRKPPTEDEYLHSPNKPTDDEGMIQASIDTAILRAFVLLADENALIQFVSKPNHCVLEDSEAFMKEYRQWTGLITLWKSRGSHEASLHLLHTLGLCGSATPPTDHRPTLFHQPIVKIVDDVLSEDGLPPQMMTIAELDRRLLQVLGRESATSDSAEGANEKEHAKYLAQLVGIICSLYYLRTLDMTHNSEKLLFASYCGWLLASLDPMYSLTMFTKSVSQHDHADVIKLLNNVGEEGSISATQRCSKYLELIMGDQCNNVDDRDLHNERAKSLIESVMEERQPEDIATTISQRKLLTFLQKSTLYDPVFVVQLLSKGPYAKSFYKERALVYKRLKQHNAAIGMFLNEIGSLEEAKEYASNVSPEEGDAFQILLQHLMKPNEQGGVKIREALDVINKCENVDAKTALPMLPEGTPLFLLKDFVSKSLRTVQSRARATHVYANVLKHRLQQAKVSAVRVRARYAIIDTDTNCAECGKKIRADTVFARFPNGVVVHQACLESEHICPHTHRDFRTGIETILH